MSAPDRSKPFTDLGVEELEGLGLSPEFAYAAGVGEREPGVFQVPYGRRAQEPHLRRWAGGDEGEAWPDLSPGVWWPTGRDGRNVIVCLGATDALFLSEQLFSVDRGGLFRRRPGLSRLLRDAVVVALPQDSPDLSLCWYADPDESVSALLEEIVTEHRDRVFLTVPLPPPEVQPRYDTRDGDPCLSRFLRVFLRVGKEYGIQPSTAPLPWLGSWRGLLDDEDHPGARKRAALGGILALWDAFSSNALAMDWYERREASGR